MAVVALALLACKKGDDEAATSASAAAEPAPAETASAAPEPSASAAPEASADTTAEAPKPAATTIVKPTTTPTTTTTAVASASASAAPAATATAQNTTAAYSRINHCCAALSSEAAKGGLTANKYKSAAAICAQIASKVKSGSVNESAARTLIRAQVQGVKVPSAC